MINNFITNEENVTLKDRLQKFIEASTELKFLVGFFYFIPYPFLLFMNPCCSQCKNMQ